MKVRLSNINCQLAFQHASSAILTRQTADRWSNTRGWRSHEVFKINAVWITIRFRWYFSILQPTLQLSFMIPALFKQEHSTVKNSRNFESRIAKIQQQQFPSGVPGVTACKDLWSGWRRSHDLPEIFIRNTVHVFVVFVEVLFGIKLVCIYQVGTSKNGNLLIYVIEILSRC